MSRESKLFTAPNKLQVSEQIKDYESFGWELLSVNGNDVSMSRNTQIPVYVHLVKYENQYEELMERIRMEQSKLNQLHYEPIKPLTLFILFLLLIFPAVLFFLYKKKKKEEYMEAKQTHEEKIAELRIEVQKIVNESRATFFAQRT